MVTTATATPAKRVGGIKALTKGRSDLFHIDPREIKIDPDFNARDFSTPENKAHVAFLADSIEVEGVREPLKLVMRGDDAYVTNGESRLRAIALLIEEGRDFPEVVPVRLEDRYSNDIDRLFTQITSNSGKNFTPLETSNLYRRMLTLGQTEEQIAARTKMDVRRVKQILDYQTLPVAVQTMISDGTVKVSLAMETFIGEGRDEKKTVATLKSAIANATAAGKKVSKKYVGGKDGEKKVSANKAARDSVAEIKSIFETADFAVDADEPGIENVIITVTKAQADRLRDLIGY